MKSWNISEVLNQVIHTNNSCGESSEWGLFVVNTLTYLKDITHLQGDLRHKGDEETQIHCQKN